MSLQWLLPIEILKAMIMATHLVKQIGKIAVLWQSERELLFQFSTPNTLSWVQRLWQRTRKPFIKVSSGQMHQATLCVYSPSQRRTLSTLSLNSNYKHRTPLTAKKHTRRWRNPEMSRKLSWILSGLRMRRMMPAVDLKNWWIGGRSRLIKSPLNKNLIINSKTR